MIFATREAFEAIGGFNEKLYAIEEAFFSKKLRKWGKKNGKKFGLIKEATVLTSLRKLKNPFRLILATSLAMFFPFFLFSRRLCWYWYKRPADSIPPESKQ